jgi:outer membrane protein OmpA-like peptidoglycan-associated protein
VKHAIIVLSGCVATALVAACGGSAPTEQLIDARRVYAEAAASEAARLTPDKLLTAEQALNKAEAEHRDDPGSAREKHLAYLASRKAAMAIAMGKIAAAEKTHQEADAEYEQKLQQQARLGQAELKQTKGDLAEEQAARAEAERRAAAAFASLAEVARVNEDQRGTVITLPGGVLFPSGGYQLSQAAKTALDKVATALIDQGDTRPMTIEGHTDSRGDESKNLELSQKRAESVRSYLVSKGVSAEAVAAVGKGEETPIADNESSEGRATNRRVEIVVAGKAQPGMDSGAAQRPNPAGAPQQPVSTMSVR